MDRGFRRRHRRVRTRADSVRKRCVVLAGGVPMQGVGPIVGSLGCTSRSEGLERSKGTYDLAVDLALAFFVLAVPRGAPVDSRTIRSVRMLYSRFASSGCSTCARRAVTAARARSKRDIWTV